MIFGFGKKEIKEVSGSPDQRKAAAMESEEAKMQEALGKIPPVVHKEKDGNGGPHSSTESKS